MFSFFVYCPKKSYQNNPAIKTILISKKKILKNKMKFFLNRRSLCLGLIAGCSLTTVDLIGLVLTIWFPVTHPLLHDTFTVGGAGVSISLTAIYQTKQTKVLNIHTKYPNFKKFYNCWSIQFIKNKFNCIALHVYCQVFN